MRVTDEEQGMRGEKESGIGDILIHMVRRDLTMIVTALIVVIALVAAFQDGAMPVLDKVLPLVMLVFGFFFGHRSNKV